MSSQNTNAITAAVAALQAAKQKFAPIEARLINEGRELARLQSGQDSARSARDDAAEQLGIAEAVGTDAEIVQARKVLDAAEARLKKSADESVIIATAKGRAAGVQKLHSEAVANIAAAQAELDAAIAAWLNAQAEQAFTAYGQAADALAVKHAQAIGIAEIVLERTGKNLVQQNAFSIQVPAFAGSSPSGWLVTASGPEHSQRIKDAVTAARSALQSVTSI